MIGFPTSLLLSGLNAPSSLSCSSWDLCCRPFTSLGASPKQYVKGQTTPAPVEPQQRVLAWASRKHSRSPAGWRFSGMIIRHTVAFPRQEEVKHRRPVRLLPAAPALWAVRGRPLLARPPPGPPLPPQLRARLRHGRRSLLPAAVAAAAAAPGAVGAACVRGAPLAGALQVSAAGATPPALRCCSVC